MSGEKKMCQGQVDSLAACSRTSDLNLMRKFLWRLKTNGPSAVLKLTLSKARKLIGVRRKKKLSCLAEEQPIFEEVLNLKPGEIVEVKSEEEILATLDRGRKTKGLLWVRSMREFCGKRFRVYKRLERMRLESTGEYRDVKNTVLLEGVMCDGQNFYGCDRSCFYFWREAWLKRIEE